MAALTDSEIDNLITTALSAKEFSYSPYSHFKVGCALLMNDGKVITGCNVENVSFGLSICAERTAYTKAISEGNTSFRAAVVSTDVDDQFTWPCGACRQFMSEFGDVEVISVGNSRKYEKSTLSQLLPKSFDLAALNNGQKNNK